MEVVLGVAYFVKKEPVKRENWKEKKFKYGEGNVKTGELVASYPVTPSGFLVFPT